VPDSLLGMGQRDGSGVERYDRVWCVQWVFPRRHPAGLPSPVIETVREVAAGLGVALTDAHGDNHDDARGGDPGLQVWRFYLRVPDLGQPAGPARDVDALTDHWAMPASAWPLAVLTLAGLIVGLASDTGLTGRVQVDFSPTLTTLERMSDLVRQSYAPQLVALESAFSRFRDTYADTTGRQLPDTLVSARWDQDQSTVVGSTALYVGEDALRWRVVQAGLAPPAGTESDHPVLPTPSPLTGPAGAPDTLWELTLSDGFRVAAPLAEAIREMVVHLDALPSTHHPDAP
jgi:hypothetical protein